MIPRPGEPAIRDDAGNLLALTDWLGNTYRVGDRVMYCIGAGRGQMMAIGRIIKFREVPSTRWHSREPLPGEEPNWDSAVGPRVRELAPIVLYGVQVLTERTSGQWDNEARTRPAWVNEMNITALPSTPKPVSQ